MLFRGPCLSLRRLAKITKYLYHAHYLYCPAQTVDTFPQMASSSREFSKQTKYLAPKNSVDAFNCWILFTSLLQL